MKIRALNTTSQNWVCARARHGPFPVPHVSDFLKSLCIALCTKEEPGLVDSLVGRGVRGLEINALLRMGSQIPRPDEEQHKGVWFSMKRRMGNTSSGIHCRKTRKWNVSFHSPVVQKFILLVLSFLISKMLLFSWPYGLGMTRMITLPARSSSHWDPPSNDSGPSLLGSSPTSPSQPHTIFCLWGLPGNIPPDAHKYSVLHTGHLLPLTRQGLFPWGCSGSIRLPRDSPLKVTASPLLPWPQFCWQCSRSKQIPLV